MSSEKEKDEKKDKPEEAKAEGEAAAAEGEGGAKKGLSKKLKIIIAAALAVLVLGGGVAAFFLMHGKEDQAQKEEQAAKEASAEKGKITYYPLGDLLVNLSGEGKHPNFLKVKISLELADEKDVPLIDAIKPKIIDNFQVYLRELRIEDLRGSAGMYRLREELLMRVTEAAQPVRIRDVLFQEMLVQ